MYNLKEKPEIQGYGLYNRIIKEAYKKRIVCPKCEEGFIHKGKDMIDYKRRNHFYSTPVIQYPTCSNCGAKFKINITDDLLIELTMA